MKGMWLGLFIIERDKWHFFLLQLVLSPLVLVLVPLLVSVPWARLLLLVPLVLLLMPTAKVSVYFDTNTHHVSQELTRLFIFLDTPIQADSKPIAGVKYV